MENKVFCCRFKLILKPKFRKEVIAVINIVVGAVFVICIWLAIHEIRKKDKK